MCLLFYVSMILTLGRLVVFPGTPASSTSKTGNHEITDFPTEVALYTHTSLQYCNSVKGLTEGKIIAHYEY